MSASTPMFSLGEVGRTLRGMAKLEPVEELEMPADLQYLLDENRVGRFHVHTTFLFDSRIRAFLGQCVIVRAERCFHWGDTVEYVAYHSDLPKSHEGAEEQLFEAHLDVTGRVRLEEVNTTIHTDGIEPLWLERRP